MAWLVAAVGVLGFVTVVGIVVVLLVVKRRAKPPIDADFERDFGGPPPLREPVRELPAPAPVDAAPAREPATPPEATAPPEAAPVATPVSATLTWDGSQEADASAPEALGAPEAPEAPGAPEAPAAAPPAAAPPATARPEAAATEAAPEATPAPEAAASAAAEAAGEPAAADLVEAPEPRVAPMCVPQAPIGPVGAPIPASSPTMVPGDFPPEPPAPAEPAPPPPAPATPAAPEDLLPPAPGGPKQVEKLRIADLGLVLRAYLLQMAGEELLCFASEGFAARGRDELCLYVRRAACPDDTVVRTLKRFAALSVIVLERQEPVRVGELIKVPGEIGSVPLGGYVAFEPNEPEPVPFGPRIVLVGVQRRQLSLDPQTLRTTLVQSVGQTPYLTAVERDEA